MIGSKRLSDSAIEQFVFFWEKDSVAAVNIETSCLGDDASVPNGMALGSFEDVFSAGPLSVPGEGGGVG